MTFAYTIYLNERDNGFFLQVRDATQASRRLQYALVNRTLDFTKDSFMEVLNANYFKKKGTFLAQNFNSKDLFELYVDFVEK